MKVIEAVLGACVEATLPKVISLFETWQTKFSPSTGHLAPSQVNM